MNHATRDSRTAVFALGIYYKDFLAALKEKPGQQTPGDALSGNDVISVFHSSKLSSAGIPSAMDEKKAHDSDHTLLIFFYLDYYGRSPL